jgi:hypothetical protein
MKNSPQKEQPQALGRDNRLSSVGKLAVFLGAPHIHVFLKHLDDQQSTSQKHNFSV